MNVSFEEMRLFAEQKRYDELEQSLAQLDVQKLTRQEQDEADALFSSLPQETVDGSSELCYRMVLLKIQRGNTGAAQKCYNTLLGMRDGLKDGSPARQLLENRIICAALCLSLEPGSNLLLNLAVLANEFGESKLPLARLSVTGKFPSVLRGARDLSGLAKHYRAAVSIVRPLLGAFVEDGGAGVCETAIAEVLYERDDLNEASLHAAAAISAENPEVSFAALSLMARIGAVDTSAKPPAEILAHIGGVLESSGAYWLRDNYKALVARFDILRGDNEKVRAWLEECDIDDLSAFALRDSYVMLTKAKAYIALGEYRNAATLLEGLTLALQKQQRTLDTAECLINGAIVCELMGNGERAIEKLEQALLLTQEFGYIRVYADHGKQLFHLIARYAREGQPNEKLGDNYIKKITKAASAFSTLCPALYQSGRDGDNGAAETEALTQSELQVLQLMDEGMSNQDIADKLSISSSTVKKHVSHIFEKLGASNRVEAIKIARDMGMLS